MPWRLLIEGGSGLMWRVRIHPGGPLRKLASPFGFPSFPAAIASSGPWQSPLPLQRHPAMIMHPLGQSLLVPAGPHLATSLTGSFHFESSACSHQWAEGCRNQLSGWEELSRCASMPNLGLAWGTWSSWLSDGFLEGNQSDLFSIFLTHRVHTCIHRSKVVYKWTKNLSSFLGGKKTPPVTSTDILILLVGVGEASHIYDLVFVYITPLAPLYPIEEISLKSNKNARCLRWPIIFSGLPPSPYLSAFLSSGDARPSWI